MSTLSDSLREYATKDQGVVQWLPSPPSPRQQVELAAADELDRLTARVAELEGALKLAEGALMQVSPCMDPECKQEQEEWRDIAIQRIRAALEHKHD